MKINFFTVNNNFFYIKNPYSSLINFGKRRNEENDSFSFSPKKLNEDELIKQIIEKREKGISDIKITKELGISRNQFEKLLKIGNIPKKKPQMITPEKKEEIKQLKTQGKTNKEIAQILGVTEKVVKYAAKRMKNNPDAPLARGKITEDLIEKVREARERGETRGETCSHLNICPATYTKCLNRGNIAKRDMYLNEKLIEKVQEARNKGEHVDETCKRLGISSRTYNICVNKGNLPLKIQKYITPEKKVLILQMRAAGKRNQEIADKLGIPYAVVANTISHASKVSPQEAEEIYNRDKQTVIELANRKLTIPEIKEATGFSEGKIKKMLAENKIKPVFITQKRKEQNKERVLELVNQGLTVPEISQKTGWKEKKIKNILTRNKISAVSIREKNGKKNEERIKELADKGLTALEMVKETGLCEKTIRKILLENKIKPVSAWEKRKAEKRARILTNGDLSVQKNLDETKQKGVTEKPITASPSAEIQTKEAEPVSKDEQIRKLKAQIKFYENSLENAKKSLSSPNPSVRNTALQTVQLFTKKLNLLKDELDKIKVIPDSLSEEPTTKHQKIQASKTKDKFFDNPEDYNLEKILSSSYVQVMDYSEKVKEEAEELTKEQIESPADGKDKIQILEKIKKDVMHKRLEYLKSPRENNILQDLLEIIDKKIKKISSEIKKFEQKKGSSSLPNVTWLEEEDFKNKLFGHKIFLNISKNANCETAEIEEAEKNLQKAYPEECVIWIDVNYDTLNTNNPNEQRYIIKGRFYESKDGRRFGQFGTWKKFTIEFLSDRKHLYKNFIENLIQNRYKIALF